MRIVILSRNPALYSTQSLVNAARERGHLVQVVDHMQCDIVIEKSNPQVFFQDKVIENVNAIIPRIGTSATSYGAAIIRQFEAQKVFTTLSSQALLTARDKLSSLQLLAAEGVGVPKSVISNNYLVFNEMLEKIEGYPKIIKLAKGTHGLGVILSENRQNAESILEAFHKVKQQLIIQEFIEEAEGADIRVFIVDDKIVGVMERKAKEGEFRSNLHRGATSRVVQLTAEEEQVSKKAAKIMGLSVAGVDMLRSKRGPLVLEVNASPGLEGIETTTGVDIAGKIIQFLERNGQSNWRK